MIDAGYSTRAKDIKHYTDFESKIICKLISSPYYIGRGASRKCYSPEVYLKNKRLCKLIDILRYKKIKRGCVCLDHTKFRDCLIYLLTYSFSIIDWY